MPESDHEARARAAWERMLEDMDIKTWPEDYPGAPPDMRWHATRGDYDLGAKVGTGATEKAAVEDLLHQLGL